MGFKKANCDHFKEYVGACLPGNSELLLKKFIIFYFDKKNMYAYLG